MIQNFFQAASMQSLLVQIFMNNMQIKTKITQPNLLTNTESITCIINFITIPILLMPSFHTTNPPPHYPLHHSPLPTIHSPPTWVSKGKSSNSRFSMKHPLILLFSKTMASPLLLKDTVCHTVSFGSLRRIVACGWCGVGGCEMMECRMVWI